MAKKRKNNYRKVETLPNEAILVDEYAKKKDISTSYIYNTWKRNVTPEQEKEEGNPQEAMNKIVFEIVLFKGMNFVLPIKKKSSKKVVV
jgi:hypothetical protein